LLQALPPCTMAYAHNDGATPLDKPRNSVLNDQVMRLHAELNALRLQSRVSEERMRRELCDSARRAQDVESRVAQSAAEMWVAGRDMARKESDAEANGQDMLLGEVEALRAELAHVRKQEMESYERAHATAAEIFRSEMAQMRSESQSELETMRHEVREASRLEEEVFARLDQQQLSGLLIQDASRSVSPVERHLFGGPSCSPHRYQTSDESSQCSLGMSKGPASARQSFGKISDVSSAQVDPVFRSFVRAHNSGRLPRYEQFANVHTIAHDDKLTSPSTPGGCGCGHLGRCEQFIVQDGKVTQLSTPGSNGKGSRASTPGRLSRSERPGSSERSRPGRCEQLVKSGSTGRDGKLTSPSRPRRNERRRLCRYELRVHPLSPGRRRLSYDGPSPLGLGERTPPRCERLVNVHSPGEDRQVTPSTPGSFQQPFYP